MRIAEKLLSAAERNLVDRADHETMREVLRRDHLLGTRIGRVQIIQPLHELRPRPCRLEAEPAAHPLLDSYLQRVIPGDADRKRRRDAGELRIGPQQLRARHRLAADARSGEFRQSEEWVRNLGAQEVDRRLVAHWRRRQILPRYGVEILRRAQMRAAITHVSDIRNDPPRQLPLRRKRPALVVRVELIAAEEADAAP